MKIVDLLNHLKGRISRRRTTGGQEHVEPADAQDEVTLTLGEKKVTIAGVSHHLGADVFDGAKAAEMDLVLVEGSLYLGGFIPADAARDKIVVMLEPPSMFTKRDTRHPSFLYLGGRAIPQEGRGPRRLFETIASEIENNSDPYGALRVVYDLLRLRGELPDVVVYNEPQLWLRTVWYESDLLFHYMLCQHDYQLFGAVIYSDMDLQFGEFLERHGNAFSAMTGDDCLLFAFDGRGGRETDLHTASRYVAYRAVLEAPGRLENSITAAELDELRKREARMLADVVGVNRSLVFARRLGVKADETPCVVFWKSLSETRVLTVPLSASGGNDTWVATMKGLAVLIAQAVATPDGDALGALSKAVANRDSQWLIPTAQSVGDVVRAFLLENTPPLRDRLMIEDIDNFERVRLISPHEVSHLLDESGYIDISEDAVQCALEQILCVPTHKKDWGGEINDLYTSNLSISGVRIPTAFMLKGKGLKRSELRISDCGKNGDQLVRLFESIAYLFVIQFVGKISEAVIADVQGKVSMKRAGGKPAWYLIIDGQDTARLLYAYGHPGSKTGTDIEATPL
jgi:hypothetical protein